MAKRVAVVNSATKEVENVITLWECPEGCEAIESEDAQIGWVKKLDGSLSKSEAMIEKEIAQLQEREARQNIRQKETQDKLDALAARRQKMKDIKTLKASIDAGEEVDLVAAVGKLIEMLSDE